MDAKDFHGTGMTTQKLKESINYHLTYTIGAHKNKPNPFECQLAIAMAARDIAIDAMNATEDKVAGSRQKKVYYLSLEFLIGRLTHSNISNMGLTELFEECAESMNWNYTDVLEAEPDPSLGNGGLGRLAACFLDSMATLGYAGYGYGINYEYGLFRQSLVNGHQREEPDGWINHHSPWQIERPDSRVSIPFGGRIEQVDTAAGESESQWVDWQLIEGIPYDIPVVGYGQSNVNYLRLFSARSSSEFDMNIFNEGDYVKAVNQKIASETVSKVLYPSDSTENGKKLRLLQEYFFVACALRDITNQHLEQNRDITALADWAAIQLNDTHPALAVAELMRLLIDEHAIGWTSAWKITQATLAYTNHTLLPEALEKWPTRLVEELLPRHCQIIYEINHKFLESVRTRYPHDHEKLARMSIVQEGEDPQFRMANLSIIGSHSVNGVAAMHSELVKSQLVPDFYDFEPHKFNNKTNGVTQRRWLHGCNPELSKLITELVGDEWLTDLYRLRDLESHAESTSVLDRLHEIKQSNKKRLVDEIFKTTKIRVSENSLFDVQIKRIHEYKRQLLNAMHIHHLYLQIKENGVTLNTPRTFIFSGKAAPSYSVAKCIIKYITSLGTLINNDPDIGDQLKVVFFPDYRVSVAEKIIPAADISEQISTAGFEASGTGNMKLSLNGALTLGTLDGANVEIKEEVGDENIYIFGHTAEELVNLRQQNYTAHECYENSPHLRRVVDSLISGEICPNEPGVFNELVDSLLTGNDYFMVFADFDHYVKTQQQIDRDYQDRAMWSRKALLNIAGCGKFSSDRTIADYAQEIWGLNYVSQSLNNAA